LQQADILIGSLDGTLSDYNPPAPCDEHYRNLMAPSEAVQGLAFAGFDVMGVATNHMKDCGLIRGCVNDSMFDTLNILTDNGILPAGAGENLEAATSASILTVKGIRFAFLGVGAINRGIWATETEPGISPFVTDVFLDAITRARAQADVVIVLPHWGREYSPLITYEQRQAAHRMVEAGATLVVGNHPHRVQGVETLPNGATVAYALGNFVFDQEWSDGTQYTIQGIMLQAHFRGAELVETTLLPIHIYDDIQPRLASEEESARILADVAASMESAPPP
jgi:poly-gamma-glutamate synthesis protein (capsule biosynthesis protein)